MNKPKGTPGKDLLRFAGTISAEDADEMMRAIEEGCERIEPDDDAWAVLERSAGTIEGPSDWSIEHDHYLYGTPKRRPEDAT